LHLGHAFAAKTAYEAAANGRFLLRIEDLDIGRRRPEFAAAIHEDLTWLGLAWDRPVIYQSTRGEAYRDALATLQRRDLIYPCFCTRREIAEEAARAAEAPHDATAGTVLYSGQCRSLTPEQRAERIAQGQRYAVRLDVRRAADLCPRLTYDELGTGPNGEHGVVTVDPMLFGDIVLARKDLPAAYHLAVVVDDAFSGVTLVTRGNDLFAATHVQRLLQALLGLPAPRYAHHRLILDENGKKFSKRDQAAALSSLRSAGVSPAQIAERLSLR
jgi:glutamyl-Q tRNA(Asp) synthetase